MGRFQLELIYFTYFSIVVPSNSCVFLFCRPFVVNTFSTGLVGVEVSAGDRRSFNTHETSLNCRINDKWSTGKKHTTISWDNDGKIGKIIN
jgi:hypothetical protein